MQRRNCGLPPGRRRNLHADHTRRDWTAAIRVAMVMVVMVMVMVLMVAVNPRWTALLVPDRGRRGRCRTRHGLVQQFAVDATRRVDADSEGREDGGGGPG